MSQWPSTQAPRVLSSLRRIGRHIKRTIDSHPVLQRSGWSDVVFAFHDREELGPRILARLSKVTGLTPNDL